MSSSHRRDHLEDLWQADPADVGGIRNFGWVARERVARGQQPPLEPATFQALHDLGIRAVLSLRPDREPPPRNSRRVWAEYHVEEEQRLAEDAGLRFYHAPLEDFAAPPPEEVAVALAELDRAVSEAPAVYVHCRAGAGRASVVTGAWLVARGGGTGDDAAANYARFMRATINQAELPADEWEVVMRRVGQPYVWWALREIVAALGSPVTRDISVLLPPERPADAVGWEPRYQAALAGWRAPTRTAGSARVP